jgi:hypothetical protein
VEAFSTGTTIRLIDENGAVSSNGLVEVSVPGGFGTVCQMSASSADVVCRQLGYDFGSLSPSPCNSYGGSNRCGAANTPVALKSLNCKGNELTIDECSFVEPDEGCLSHISDAVVFCGNAESPLLLREVCGCLMLRVLRPFLNQAPAQQADWKSLLLVLGPRFVKKGFRPDRHQLLVNKWVSVVIPDPVAAVAKVCVVVLPPMSVMFRVLVQKRVFLLAP